MDSGNSGSLQSSSAGGDDEFDSGCGGAADSSPLSAVLLRQPAAGSFYGLQELATPPLSQAPLIWPSAPFATGAAGASPSPPLPCHGAAASAGQAAALSQPAVAAPPRGPRKRTRASRRAPTTVLTTDTSNFRAMVQEFTGIPSPPFSGASARSRFDHLFHPPSTLRFAAAAAAGSHASVAPYILRPFAHKLQASPFSPPCTSLPATSTLAIAASTAASAATTTTAVASGNSYQPASAPSALLQMQDHSRNYVSFQSPLGAQLAGDANCKYPPANPIMFDAAGVPSAPRLQDPVDVVGLSHGIMSSERPQLHPRNRDDGHGGDELSGLVGGASVTRTAVAGGCKTAYSSVTISASRATPLLNRNAQGSSADIGAAVTTATPATATAAMRTQGVDSWICTSD
ncbi:hypothetical protein ACP70R_046229 [Stipagrostis hirtigluma subsp. patula]